MHTEEFFRANAKAIELVARVANEAFQAFCVLHALPSRGHWSGIGAGAQYEALQLVKRVLNGEAAGESEVDKLFGDVARVTAEHFGLMSSAVATEEPKKRR